MFDTSMYSYASWIPTVAGRLSFRHVGDTVFPNKTLTANIFVDDSERIIFVQQNRDLSDALAKPITHKVYSIDGLFNFALFARQQSNSEDLFGTVYIFRDIERWIADIFPHMERSVKEIDRIRLNDNHGTLFSSAIIGEFNKIENLCKPNCIISLDIFIKRTGEIYLARPEFKDKTLEENTVSFASQQGHDFYKWIADQSYFFIRDIIHEHQHHNRDTDTIIITQSLDKNDTSWRRNVLFSLYHYVIKQKRTGDINILLQSVGIINYIESFTGICKDKELDTPLYQTASLRGSILAKIDEIKTTNAILHHNNSLTIASRSAVLTGIALLVAIFAKPIQERASSNKLGAYAFRMLDKLDIDLVTFFMTAVLLTFIYYRLPDRRFKSAMSAVGLSVDSIKSASDIAFLVFLLIFYLLYRAL